MELKNYNIFCVNKTPKYFDHYRDGFYINHTATYYLDSADTLVDAKALTKDLAKVRKLTNIRQLNQTLEFYNLKLSDCALAIYKAEDCTIYENAYKLKHIYPKFNPTAAIAIFDIKTKKWIKKANCV